MRLFLALDLPEPLVQRLDRLIGTLRPEALIKWSPVHNLHVTTKFIGEWPQERLDEIDEALRGMKQRAPFSVAVKGFGWFPNARSPRVFWCGIDGGESLRTLAQETEEALLSVGITKEGKAFSPHLTLARINSPAPLERLRERVKGMTDLEVGEFEVTRFFLYQSVPGPNTSQYHKLREYAFAAPAAAGKATS